MPNQPNGDELYIGAGKVYFDRFDASGLSTGLRFVGDVSKFEINPSVEEKDAWDHTKKTKTKLATITTTQTHEITIDMAEYRAENLALALLGTAAFYTQVGGTITGELLASSTQATSTLPTAASLVPNSVLQTAQRNISLVTLTATSSGSPVTLTAGTDYEIEDATEGLIRILSVSNFPSGITGITASYTAAAVTATAAKKIITAGATPQVLGRLMFVGDPVQGKARTVNAWRVKIKPSSATAFISDDLSNISLSGQVLDDSANHPTYPLYQVITR